jgi:hypothetical protein
MVTHADSQAGGEPQQENGYRQSVPVEHEESGNGPDVKDRKDEEGGPIQSSAIVKVNNVLIHGFQFQASRESSTAL